MTSRYEATLNDNALSTRDPSILITDISHAPASISADTSSVAKRQGATVYRRYVDKCSVTITFQIRKYAIAERQAVVDSINTWARNGGTLKTNDRPGKKLDVICEKFVAINSAMRWTDPLQITFSAYSIPFWQSLAPSERTLTGTTGSTTFAASGNVKDTPVEVQATVTSGTLQNISFTVNDRTMTISGLNLANGKTLYVTYTAQMVQRIIDTNGNSFLDKRTGVDDLLCDGGSTGTFSYTANTSVRVVFKPKGWWY